jgi:hypothetical protein
MHYRLDQAKHKRPFDGAEQRLDLDRESRRFVSAFEVLVRNLLLISLTRSSDLCAGQHRSAVIVPEKR